MMNAAHIIESVVKNIIVVDDLSFPVDEGILIAADNETQIGGLYIGGKFYPYRPSNSQQRENRHRAYVLESDPIYFMAQRGEATEEEWQAKITEIKERYPYYFDDEGNLLEAA